VVIARRGSARRFEEHPITIEGLATMLTIATRPVPLDVLRPDAPRLNDVYLIVHAVDGLEGGVYATTRGGRALELLRTGDFREASDELSVSKGIARTAAVNVYFLADLDAVGRRWGDRGYRVAQLEASIMGGRLYLAAYALGLAASGLTFYDDAVTAFFSPHAQGKGVMFLMTLGQ
jgi:SagB-type dehydrogenase family enzyme